MKKTHPISEDTAKENRTAQNKKAWDAARKKAEATMKQREGKYNGVIGYPPEWLPDYIKEQFVSIRNELLNKYSPKQILQYMQAREKSPNVSGAISTPTYPFEITSLLNSLITIKNISSMGKDKGLKACLGKESKKTFQSNMQSTIAKRSRTDALSNLINQIIKRNPEAEPSKIFADLEKEEGNGVIEKVIENTVEWTNKNKNAEATSIENVMARIYRAKNKFSR